MSRQHKNINYYFVFWDSEEKIWKLNNQRFILTPYDNLLMGQYITSMWFNTKIDKYEDIGFMIIGVENSDDKYQVVKEINNSKNRIPSVNDIPYNNRYAKFVEYYEASGSLIERICKDCSKNGEFNFKFKGNINYNNTLNIRFNLYKNELIICLPEFNIEI